MPAYLSACGQWHSSSARRGFMRRLLWMDKMAHIHMLCCKWSLLFISFTKPFFFQPILSCLWSTQIEKSGLLIYCGQPSLSPSAWMLSSPFDLSFFKVFSALQIAYFGNSLILISVKSLAPGKLDSVVMICSNFESISSILLTGSLVCS